MFGAKYKELSNRIDKLEKKFCCINGSGGCCYFEVTRSQLETLVSESSLLKGATYKITDRGDLGLWFDAISETELNPEGVRKMLVPSFYGLVTDDFGNVWKGIWHTDRDCIYGNTLSIGDLVVYNGLVWRSLTGVVGNEPWGDDTNWELVPKESFTNNEYIPMVFGVIYDYENDWISKQWDDNGNIFGVAYYSKFLSVPPAFNPVDYSDWNWGRNGQVLPGHFYNNHAIGSWNNIALGTGDDHSAIFGNRITEGAIYNNYVSNWIYNNRIPNDIAFNGTCVEPNEYINNIRYNINNGSITYVAPTGTIEIEYNTNNGSITGTHAVDISDPIVNK